MSKRAGFWFVYYYCMVVGARLRSAAAVLIAVAMVAAYLRIYSQQLGENGDDGYNVSALMCPVLFI